MFDARSKSPGLHADKLRLVVPAEEREEVAAVHSAGSRGTKMRLPREVVDASDSSMILLTLL